MKIPTATEERRPPLASPIAPSAPQPDETPSSPREGIELLGEDGASAPVAVPPPEAIARVHAQAASPIAEGTDTADELAHQLAAQPPDMPTTPVPSAVVSAATPERQAARQQPPAPPAADDRPPFKVVVSFKPAADNRWHATIAVGRDGCDPYWEPANVDEWQDALDGVLGVQAAAEARWAEQPRNKTAQHAEGTRIGGRKAAAAPANPPAAANATPAVGRTIAKDPADANRKRQAPNSPDQGKAPPSAESAPIGGTPRPTEQHRETPPAPVGGVEKLALF